MPITTGIRIIIELAGQSERSAPTTRYIAADRTIRLVELPAPGASTFILHVSMHGGEKETQLPAAEAKHLSALLAQLPPQGMTSEAVSFDGFVYDLTVMRAEQTLSFHWQNDGWRYETDDDLRDKWKSVAAVADYALELAKEQ